ncbi:MAG: YbaK/prolyl-tRNA synthetase associated region, partial [uncultured Frankineae bacterium]
DGGHPCPAGTPGLRTGPRGAPARAGGEPARGRAGARRRTGRRRQDPGGPPRRGRPPVRPRAGPADPVLAAAAVRAGGLAPVPAGRDDRPAGDRLRAGHHHTVRSRPRLAGRRRRPAAGPPHHPRRRRCRGRGRPRRRRRPRGAGRDRRRRHRPRGL